MNFHVDPGRPAAPSLPRSKRGLRVLRKRAEDRIQQLIRLLDAIDGDPDLEPYLAGVDPITSDREGDEDCDLESGNDDEPWLGATIAMNQDHAWLAPVGAGIDAEDQCDDEGAPDHREGAHHG